MKARAGKQNITLSLRRETIRKAKVIAARQEKSVSGLLEEQVEALVERDDAYQLAMARALALLDQGFHLGYERVDRSELHDRKGLRRQ